MTRLDSNSFYHFGFFVKHSKDYNEIHKISDQEKLNDFVNGYLNKLLIHCYQNVPYYKRLFNGLNSSEIDINLFTTKIPILKKDIIRKNFNDLTDVDLENRNYYLNASGGSTGEPVKIVQDSHYSKWANIALYYYYKDIIGVDELAEKKIILWGSESDLISGKTSLTKNFLNKIHKTKFLNSFMMNEEDMGRYIQEINTYKPNLIRGYAGSLYEISKFAEKKNIEVHSPKVIVSSAETLNDNMRSQIESVFGAKVYNFYGSREVSCLAGECSHGNLHVLNFKNYFEVLDQKDKPVKNGEEGRFIVTDLHNYAMPLVRYEIGDTVILGPKKCKCGNILPTLKKVKGRITDHFILRNGTMVHGEYFTRFFSAGADYYLKEWVESFQIIQEDYEKIRILVVLNGSINESEQKEIEDKIRYVMGYSCEIKWEIVDEIPKTKSGKYIYTKSMVNN